MTKADLVTKIAHNTGLTKITVDGILDAFIEELSDLLANGESLTLTGFGTFALVDRKAREGRNPQTGKTISIAAKKVVKFKAGKNLKELIASQ